MTDWKIVKTELLILLIVFSVGTFLLDIRQNKEIEFIESNVALPENCHYQYDPARIIGTNEKGEEVYIHYVACKKQP